MSSNVLADRDTNAPLGAEKPEGFKPKSMEYHRQVLQSRMNDESISNTYVSPSDTILSPCSTKLAAMKNKHFMKAQPKSLFAAKKVAAAAPAAAVPRTSAPATTEPAPLGQDHGQA